MTVGASLIELATTAVVLSNAVPPTPSLTAMDSSVVSAVPGATRLAAGVKTNPLKADVAALAEPENVYVTPTGPVNPFNVVNAPFAALSRETSTVSVWPSGSPMTTLANGMIVLLSVVD